MQLLINWFKRYFSDPDVVFLALFIATTLLVIIFMGNMLTPVLASIVIAYLLDGLVIGLHKRQVPHLVAVVIVFSAFMTLLILMLLGVLPLVSQQLSQLVQQLPNMLAKGQVVLMELPQRYPDIVSADQVEQVVSIAKDELTMAGQQIVSKSLASVVGIITILVYLVLMPMLVFFFLKDKRIIIQWFTRFMPSTNSFATKVWEDVDVQIANYVRGKFWEILVVFVVCFVAFRFLGLQYALLLAFLVGLSVIIPYIGAAVVTFPVLLIAWFQWQWGNDFIAVAVVYFIIQALDGNLLVPLLFSEVVNLHPVAIIVAILVFGGLWGFWGVFFAIPMATFIQATIRSWPSPEAIERAS